MNPNFGSMVAVFSAPRSSIRPVTARFGAADAAQQHMHIKYMFIVQRYGLMPALPARFCTAIAVVPSMETPLVLSRREALALGNAGLGSELL
jgi:hypothetical protein